MLSGATDQWRKAGARDKELFRERHPVPRRSRGFAVYKAGVRIVQRRVGSAHTRTLAGHETRLSCSIRVT